MLLKYQIYPCTTNKFLSSSLIPSLVPCKAISHAHPLSPLKISKIIIIQIVNLINLLEISEFYRVPAAVTGDDAALLALQQQRAQLANVSHAGRRLVAGRGRPEVVWRPAYGWLDNQEEREHGELIGAALP